MRFAGDVAVVSGGASGLGLATARHLVESGMKVALLDLESSPGPTSAKELGDGAAFVPADVTSDEQVEQAMANAQELGAIRVVVNCAGIGTPARVISRGKALPLADFERVVRINLIGTFNVLRVGALAMLDAEPVDGERGVIINTASVAATDGQIGQAAYSASKAGVAGMTLPIARDLADKLIRVVTIAPGIFETPMLAGLSEEVQASLGAQVPHPSRLGRPDEYAALVQHIVDNSMINGEVIRLDGALRPGPR